MTHSAWFDQYDSGVPHTIDLPDHPMPQILRQTAQSYPNRDAVRMSGMLPVLGEQNLALTYRQLDNLVDRFASAFQQAGLQKGDRVALYMPNCPQFTIAYQGVLRAGGIAVPSNPLYVAREIEHQLKDSGATFAVVLSMLYPNVKQVRDNTQLKQVIVTNIKEYFPFLLKTLFTFAKEKQDGHRIDISQDADTVWFQDFLAPEGSTPTSAEVAMDDTAVLMYTGGTTGTPKGAELTHRNITANPMQAKAWLNPVGIEPGNEVMLTALPLTHSYSMTACMNLSICDGYTQILIPNPRDLIHVLSAIDKHKVSIVPGVPTLYNALANHEQVKAGKFSLRSIKFCLSGASGLPVEVQKHFQNVTGSRLVEAYGLSEASPALSVNPVGSGGRIGTIGLPIPNTEIKVVDLETERKEVPVGEAGILCAHGPQVMKGYWNRPDATASTIRTHDDGKKWLHTGDVAVMEEDGYFRIVDRQKDMILAASGFNVYPRDIEERLFEHPKILEAAAIGVPVGSKDQRSKVFIVLQPDQTITEQEVIDWCREGLAKYKVPKFVEFRETLPKTMVGKVLRRQLAEEEKQGLIN